MLMKRISLVNSFDNRISSVFGERITPKHSNGGKSSNDEYINKRVIITRVYL